ncbi:DUF3060 domain-containing protein [Mycobacterium sp. 663a-19]|uniref:DUF3060 domain-containing protein n=1 Tax=Mycobacterium sp. 663a-19 TaxID=2986148 RepID=UPI002D1F19B4|nr:DUF3060 domain-containing protein [Mycobacterium sp. 663a-19]MEB3982500.1 DUF3060 domain-containing protein [Mycobacterium sp. 663a-19]
MQDDDPEKRIRELERGLADTTRPAPGAPYTGSAPPPPDSSYYYPSPTPPRRTGPSFRILMLVVLFVSIGAAVMAIVGSLAANNRPTAGPGPRATPSNRPTAVPQGGEIRVGGNMETKTIACNDGTLTLYGYGSTYSVTGHCVSLTAGGYNNNITVDNVDTLEATGYGNTVTDRACNKCKLTLSSYGLVVNVTGHAASLTITSYDNKVIIDSADAINVSGYNNDVTYHSGKPKIADSGYSNTIHQG